MGLLSIKGTVTAIGQSQFDNNMAVYAYLEITEANGRRVMIDKVAVCNDTASVLQLGCVGEFYFDRMFIYGRRFFCQLWGIKGDDTVVIDRHHLRKMVAAHHVFVGLLMLPVGGFGLFWLLPALFSGLTMLSGRVNRRRMFYGLNPGEALRLQRQQAVRIMTC